jgi:hypothetical protein
VGASKAGVRNLAFGPVPVILADVLTYCGWKLALQAGPMQVWRCFISQHHTQPTVLRE